MSKLRVAVTGGSGRIGSRVVCHLWELGHTVYNVDRRPPAEATTAKYLCADLRQRSQVQPIFESVDAVCHLAEFPGPGACPAGEDLFIHNTTVGATVLQTAADLKLKRFVYTSTCQVYGFWGGPVIAPLHLPIDETHPYQAANVYAAAKVANEQLAFAMARSHGLSVAIFRFPGVWRHENVDQWDRWFDERPYFGDGCGTYLGLDDAARAYALALEHPRAGCEAYHFTAAEIAATLPLSEVIGKHYPGFPKLPAAWPALKSPVVCDKAKEHFGWAPEFNVLEIFRQKFGRDPRPPKQ
jgi:nucleoside-diphosphate-sugar epimerase